MAECVIADANETIVKQKFYEVYKNWCGSYSERAVSQKALKEALKQIIPNLDECRAQSNAPWCWLGVKWSLDAAAYMPPTIIKGSGTPP